MVAKRKARTAADVPVSDELAAVLAAMTKQFGAGTVMYGNESVQPWRIPTGIFTFDYATLGGIPHNRVTMFHGPKHSGKSTGALRCVAGAQRSLPDQKAVFVDVEGTFDEVWAEKVGVDTSEMVLVSPDYGEQAVDATVGLVHAKETSLIVIDSLAALLPIKEQEASAEDSLVGQQSRLITSMLRKVSAAQIAERKRGHFVTILLINQQRSKIGGWSPTGDPLSLPGGKALGHFTSLEVRFKNKENVAKDDDGFETLSVNEHAFAIEKNKCNAGMRSGEFTMLRRDDPKLGLGEGDIDDATTMLTFAKRLGWYTGAGRGQSLEFADVSEKFGSIDEASAWLYDNRETYWRLRCFLIAHAAEKCGMKAPFIDYLRGEAAYNPMELEEAEAPVVARRTRRS